jgi:hypothetical protein
MVMNWPRPTPFTSKSIHRVNGTDWAACGSKKPRQWLAIAKTSAAGRPAWRGSIPRRRFVSLYSVDARYVMQLSEVYRPKDWASVIGQDAIRAKVDTLRPRGLGGRAYWLAGGSGQGKTTIARIIAGELASEWATDEIDAQDVTMETIRDFERTLGQRAIADDSGRTGRALIINEAHGMRAAIVSRLLTLIERLPAHVLVVFTTTNAGEAKLFDDMDDAGPLLSRCVRLPLAQRGLSDAFAERMVAAARADGLLNGKGDDYYRARCVRLLKDNRNNCRAAWQAIDSGYLTASDEH